MSSRAARVSRRRQTVSAAVAAAAAALAARDASAQSRQVLTQWNFDNFSTGTNLNPAPTIGTGTATALGMDNNYTLADGHTFSVNASDITSTPLDPSKASGPGLTNGWRIRGNGGGGGNGWSLNAPQYTQGAEFDVSTAGVSGVIFTADWFSTNQGIHTLQEQYNLDITNPNGWTNINPLQNSVSNGYNYGLTIDLTNIAGSSNNANLGIRLVSAYDPNPPAGGVTYSGGDGSVIYNNSSGNWRFANVSFSFLGTNVISGGLTPTLTWNPPNTTWNNTNTNWKDTNNASVSFGGTSTIAAFTDSGFGTNTTSTTVSIATNGVSAAGVSVSNTSRTYVFSGGSIDGGAFTKSGAGNVVLANGSNTFNGLNLLGGTLHAASDALLGAASSRVTINGGTLVADAALNLSHFTVIGTNGGSLNTNGFSGTVSGTFTVGGAFTKTGAGDITFTGQVATSPGATFSVASGNVTFAGTGSAAVIIAPTGSNTFGGNIIVANTKGVSVQGGTIDGPGHIEIQTNNSGFTGDSSSGTALVTVNMPIQINTLGLGGTFTANVGMSGLNDLMILTPKAVVSGNGNVVWAGKLSGGGKATLLIQSQSTYTGDTIINNEAPGVTKLGVDNPFPTGSNMSLGDGSSTLNIGAVDLAGFNLKVASLKTNLPNGTNQIAQFANGITNTGSNLSTLTISGTATTTMDAIIGVPTIAVPNATDNIALTLDASNTGSMTLQGLNTYKGLTTVNGGTLQFNAAILTIGNNTQSSLPTGGNIANNANVIINSPNTVAGTISGNGTTTVNGTNLSYIGTVLSPTLAATSITQGALVNNGTVTTSAGGSIGQVSGAGTLTVGDGSTPTTLKVGTSLNQSVVTLLSGANLSLATSGAHVASLVNQLTVPTGSKVDLGPGGIAIDYGTGASALPQLKALILAGRSGGTWSGTGITSAVVAANPGQLAIGYAEASQVTAGTTGTFMGQTIAAPSHVALARVTYVGDVNLDAQVDKNDIRSLATSGLYSDGLTTHTWTQGDFNGDGAFDKNDIRMVATGNVYNVGSFDPPASEPVTLTSRVHAAASASGSVAAATTPITYNYNPATGDVTVSLNGNATVVEVDLISATNKFLTAGSKLQSGGLTFVTNSTHEQDGFSNFGSFITDGFDLGTILPAGLTLAQLQNDLTAQYSVSGNSNYVAANIAVPEPVSLSLLALGSAGLLARRRRRA